VGITSRTILHLPIVEMEMFGSAWWPTTVIPAKWEVIIQGDQEKRSRPYLENKLKKKKDGALLAEHLPRSNPRKNSLRDAWGVAQGWSPRLARTRSGFQAQH
jgi:hypothetical protein